MENKTRSKGLRKGLLLLCSFFSLLVCSNLYGQTIDITGVVQDDLGEPIIGANVSIKGTARGTITDFDGRFSISAPAEGTLVISYLGYLTQEVQIQGKKTFQVILKEDVELLDEVVVVGYGTVKKEDLTGSIATLSADELSQVKSTTASDMLVGKIPGVTVTTDGGAPGGGAMIRIRGGSSMSASNDPLIVIDGVPVDNQGINGMANPLSAINPSDIESFSVLKDASATAIYGSRASNGVIIITTKKGAAGKMKVGYSGSVSVNTKTGTLDVMSADTFREFVLDKYGADSDQGKALGEANTDWQKEILRTSVSTDHNVSLSGSIIKNLPYRVSIGYTNDQGILKTSKLERWTGSVNLSPKFFDDHLSVNLNVRGVYNKNRFADTGAIGSASEFDPTKPVYIADYDSSQPISEYNSPYGNGYYMSLIKGASPIGIALANPVGILNQKQDKSTVKRSIGNLQLDYKVHYVDGLRANLNLGYDVSSSSGDVFIMDNSPMSYTQGEIKGGWGENSSYTQLKRNHLLEFYLAYDKMIGKHKFDVLAGYSWQHFYRKDITKYPYSAAQAEKTGEEFYKTRTGYASESYLISFFGRANYLFDQRYMFTFTLRNDGSSRFAKGNRWGLFPSVALAWRISEEAFMKEQDVLSDLKLRLGYGITGQQDVGQDYPHLARYRYSEAGANYFFGDQQYTLLRPEKYDKNLKWEETTTYNVGLDFGFLRNRISGSIDAYYRKTDNLLNTVSVPAGANFGNILLTNVGELVNRGLEFNIIGRVIESKDLNWTVNYNVGYNRNRITKLTDYDDPNYVGVIHGGITGGTGINILLHKTGAPFGSFYVYEQIYDQEGKPVEGAYVDQNGDNEINDKDLIAYKDPAPDVVMGFSSELVYKNWDFSFAMHANIGSYAYNNVLSNRVAYGGADLYDPSGFFKNRMNAAKNLNFSTPQYQSSHYVQKTSFLRMDNISLGYTFNESKIPGSLRVYASVQNPFVITSYKGLDPEFSNEGIDNNIYPRPRTFLLGLSYNF